MCCYSLLASVAAVAYTFVSYEAVRCKSYLSSNPCKLCIQYHEYVNGSNSPPHLKLSGLYIRQSHTHSFVMAAFLDIGI